MDDDSQLLFFDTFSHETSEELNLDLVQFPKPVVLSEVRIIPLGARVQADFPGGVRLGATNPSQFSIEFFVNDLSKPGASTFESLGSLDYKQNGNIQLLFEKRPTTQIPTDGLVLRGWYTTITLAVYGNVSKGLTENANANSSAHAAGTQNLEPESRSPRPEWTANETRPFKDSSQEYQRYPPPEPRAYNEQFNDDWQYQQNDRDYKKEHWDGRGGGERWERGDSGNQPRHGSGRANWDWSEGRQNENHDRPEWNNRGSRRSWEEQQQQPPQPQQQHNSRKRPHTPPMDDKKWTKSNEKSPHEGDPKEENAAVVTTFTALSPGDVESISSDGDIGDDFADADVGNGNAVCSPPHAEPIAVEHSPPPSTPDQDPEQYEPILSDEELDDGEFQDYEFDDIKDIAIEKVPEFDPHQPLQAIENLGDPSLTPGENLERNPSLGVVDEDNKFMGTMDTWQLSSEFSETWVEMLEQIVPLVAVSVHRKPDCVPTLVKWVQIGLDIERAKEQSQPAFKVRHLKAGLRLAHSLTLAGCNALNLLVEADLFTMLVGLLKEQYMALSLKLLCLSVLDGALCRRDVVEKFIAFCPEPGHNGVAFLLTQWQNTKVTRVKFVLNNLIRKINFFETLCFVEQNCSNPESDSTRIRFALQSIQDVYANSVQKIGQFKRFLPVGMHFSFPGSVHDPYMAIYAFMRSTRLLESLLVLLSQPQVDETISTEAVDLLGRLLRSDHGMRFLATQPGPTQLLIRVLGDQPLTLKAAYSLRALSILDELAKIDIENLSSDDDVEPLKALQLLCETATGRFHVAQVLALADFSNPLYKIVKIAAPMSTTKNLCLDLIHSTISLVDEPEYLNRYGGQLRQLFTDENKLAPLAFWVRHYDSTNVQALCQELAANIDKAKVSTEELIPVLRALRALALPQLDEGAVDFLDASRRQLLLELFSHDGLSTLSSLLGTLASVYEHPELHAAALSGCKGTNVINVVHPSLCLLRAILALVASSQGAVFKNMTPVAALLNIYELLHAFPSDTPFYNRVSECMRLSVQCLMAYTQPCSEEQLPKSTWTQMAAEVFKHIALRPNTALPGLDLLSKLLPKPLPVCGTQLVRSDDEKRILSFYRLWGAHLHPLASAIHEMISLFSVSSVSRLAAKLLEICSLIADLGPSLALIVVQSVVEGLVSSIKSDRKMGYNSDMTRRRLALLTALSARGAPRIALLHLLRNGASEENGLVTLLAWTLNRNIQDKFYAEIKIILQLFSNLFQPKESVFSSEWKALPSKEIIQSVSNCLLVFTAALAKEQKASHSKDILSAMSVLHLVANLDTHCHWVKLCLESRTEPFASVLCFCVANETGREDIVLQLSQFLRKCYPNLETAATLLSRICGCDASNHESHPLKQLTELVQCSELSEIFKLVSDVQTSDIPLEKALDSDVPTNGVVEQLPVQFLLQEATRDCAPPLPSLLPSLPESKEHLKILDLAEIVAATLPDINLAQEIEKLNNMLRGDEMRANQNDVALSRERTVRKPMSAPSRGRLLFPRSVPSSRGDTFRSRPPNTSRPPSLHVDDFLALESAGQQPTGPTGYNKQTMRAAKEMMVTRPRMRGRPMASERSGRFMATPAPTYRR